MAPIVTTRESSSAGKGLFASSDIEAETVVLQEERPLLAVLDSTHLKEACAWCFEFKGESAEEVELRVCTGCRILRFCGVECQTAAWKHSHKLECKLYKKLFPAALPNTARVLMQILLRRKKSTFTQDEWTALYGLQHHIDDFKRYGGSGIETYQNIQLMSRAAQEYGETGDDLGLVETVAGRILINSLTLTTPLYTPLGLVLSVKAALMNHSCEPNCVVSYSGPRLTVRALRPIKAEDELTISYIDITFPPEVRREELSSRYFFKCVCPACSGPRTIGQPEPPLEIADIPAAQLDQLERNAIEHIGLAAQAKGTISPKGLTHLARALVLFDDYPSFPAWRQPLARVRTDMILETLSLKARKPWLACWLQSLIQRVYADPITFPEEAHPVRVTRAWVFARLTSQMAAVQFGDGGDDVRDFRVEFDLEWQLITWVLVSEVADLVGRSHGKGTRLDLEVQQGLADMRRGFEVRERELPDAQTVEDCKGKLTRAAAEGWSWWKKWELRTRKKRPFKPIFPGDPEDIDFVGYLIGERE